MRPDDELPAEPTDADAERACDEMRDHLGRARKVVEQYRNILSDVPKRSKAPTDRRN